MKNKTPFQQFTQTMDALMAVPHSELKQKLDKEKRDRKKKKREKGVILIFPVCSLSGFCYFEGIPILCV